METEYWLFLGLNCLICVFTWVAFLLFKKELKYAQEWSDVVIATLGEEMDDDRDDDDRIALGEEKDTRE